MRDARRKIGLNALGKSIDPCQPTQSADIDQTFSLSSNVIHVKGSFCIIRQSFASQNRFY